MEVLPLYPDRKAVERVGRAGAKWYPAADDVIVCRVLGDIKLLVDARDFSLTPHLVMEGFWEAWVTTWFVLNVQKYDVVLNIGANCGYYTMLAARLGATVHAVEPQERFADMIRTSAILNGWSDRVYIHRNVAGADNRMVDLWVHPALKGSAQVRYMGSGLGWEAVQVTQHATDVFEPAATLVFIDAEGSELEIWKGMKDMRAGSTLRTIVMEWSPQRYGPEIYDIVDEMAAWGDFYIVDFEGREQSIPPALLTQGARKLDWDTVVLRRKK